MLRTNFFEMIRVGQVRTLVLVFGAAVMAALLLIRLQAADPAHAVTRPPFTVNSTGDAVDANHGDGICQTATAGECTLRAAIEEANAFRGADTIAFNIPGSGVQTISPGSELPTITKRVTIGGYTQPGSSPNTNPQGAIDASPLIELHGAGVTNYCYGLRVAVGASNVVIRGLVINNFEFCGSANSSSAPGIHLSGTGHKVEGNFIGTYPSGTDPSGVGLKRNGHGVFLNDADNSTIGGTTPDKRNLISGNVRSGVQVFNGSSGNTIQGNLIGLDKNGDPLGNAVSSGVEISSDTGNRILSNSIYDNGKLGINLNGGTQDTNGVTDNDDKDPDTGPNRLQNYPDITSAQVFRELFGNTTDISGKLTSTPSTRKKKRTFTIQFFSSPEADPSGFGEGKTFLGQTKVTTNRRGEGSFTFTANQDLTGQYVTATATNNKTGDTSEFSNAKLVEEPVIEPGRDSS